MFEIVFNFLAVLIHDFRLNFSESAGHPQPLWQMDTRPSPLAWDIRKKKSNQPENLQDNGRIWKCQITGLQ